MTAKAALLRAAGLSPVLRVYAPDPFTDPMQSAKVVGLRYVRDTAAGFRRVRRGCGFHYLDALGRPVQDELHLTRIRALVIPPAWREVWICPLANGHLQATGRDQRGRKQYRYHPRYRALREETKYDRMIAFGKALPAIRRRVQHDLRLPGLPRDKVIATVVRLLEMTRARVGNEEYAQHNGSFGLTTLRDRHVRIDHGTLHFAYPGKSGRKVRIDVDDPRLAAIVKRCRDLPGQELFQYVGDDGNRHALDSADVNDYLRSITGQDFTAKDFRTWSGTVLAARALRRCGPCSQGKTRANRNIVAAIDAVADCLHNTRAVCRNSYIHPAVIEAYLNGALFEQPPRSAEPLRAEEKALLHLLKRSRIEARRRRA